MSLHSPESFRGKKFHDDHDKRNSAHRTTKDQLANEAFKIEAEGIPKLQAWIKENYGLTVQFIRLNRTLPQGDLGRYDGSRSDRLLYLQKLKTQIQKFPPEVFKTLNLKNLKISASITDRDARPLAAATPLTGSTFYIYGKDPWPFYHEIFHRFEHVNLGGYTDTKILKDKDLKPTEKLNNNLVSLRNDKAWFDLDPNYDKSIDINEHQANYFYYLMNLENHDIKNGPYAEIMETAEGKAQMEIMKDWAQKWSGGLLNEQYWKDLEEGHVNEDYWSESRLKSIPKN